MLNFPTKRVFSLLGIPRSGKDVVAQYLKETRGFEIFAFADQVKEEYGISKEAFESAKLSGDPGDIENIRNDLWHFSEQIRAKDPVHFINGVIDKIRISPNSAVVTDIRTKDEMAAIFDFVYEGTMYFVDDGEPHEKDGLLIQSKLKMADIDTEIKYGKIKVIQNAKQGLYYFYQYLDRFFLNEDISCLISDTEDKNEVIRYLECFNISQKGSF